MKKNNSPSLKTKKIKQADNEESEVNEKAQQKQQRSKSLNSKIKTQQKSEKNKASKSSSKLKPKNKIENENEKIDIQEEEKLQENEVKSNNIVEKKQKNQQQDIEEILQKSFYMQEVVELSQALLGKIIVRKLKDGTLLKCMIVEAEAYKAPLDKACHAYNNKKTDKTKYFWQDGGHLYIYSIYGNNFCMNITAATKEEPEAVLIRAVEPVYGLEDIKKIRKMDNKKQKWTLKQLAQLSNGPGKVGATLCLDKAFNAYDLCQPNAEIYLIENQSFKFEMGVSKRMNIDYAEEWIDKPWRFFIKDNEFVSK